jgi:hypothetical protein
MSWPLRYRTLSFAVTLGVTTAEFLLLGLPIGLIVHFAHLATTSRIAATMIVLCALWSFGVAIYAHLRAAGRTARAAAPNGSS